jgi:spore coat protein U-like protein
LKTNILKLIVVTLGLVLLSVGASAQTTVTNTMAVSAIVTANCTISAAGLAFGGYDPFGTNATNPLPGNAMLTIKCTSGAPATINMDQGLHDTTGTAGAPARQMMLGGNFLRYDLFQDAGMTTVWANTPGTAASYTGTGATDTSVFVYGQVLPGQNVPVGTYNDTVTVSITF